MGSDESVEEGRGVGEGCSRGREVVGEEGGELEEGRDGDEGCSRGRGASSSVALGW